MTRIGLLLIRIRELVRRALRYIGDLVKEAKYAIGIFVALPILIYVVYLACSILLFVSGEICKFYDVSVFDRMGWEDLIPYGECRSRFDPWAPDWSSD